LSLPGVVAAVGKMVLVVVQVDLGLMLLVNHRVEVLRLNLLL
jgi:hypothetical protein